MVIQDKWKHGAIPALLIHGCIGTVYCWSMLGAAIQEKIGEGYEWAFSLAIFFLGLSAAFLGPFVENNVKKASRFSALFFGTGMILSGVACYLGSRTMFFLSYGVIMGIGLGLGYLSPVKTLILWFKQNKGLATGLAISGFGLAKVLATPSFQYVLSNYGIIAMFISHGLFYSAVMLISSTLLKKPEGTEISQARISVRGSLESIARVLKMPRIWIYWAIFYLNISAGLAIISHEKVLFTHAGYIEYISLALVMCAVFNTLGRFCVSWASDYLKNRWTAFIIILFVSSLACFTFPLSIIVLTPVAILACNAGYGAMFSTMPSALSDRYGVAQVSEVHGVILSAWAFAGLTGNQLANFIVRIDGGATDNIIPVAGALYALGLLLSLLKEKNKAV